VVVGWPLKEEAFTEGEQGDGGGARVPKRGKVTATGGPPDLHVGVSGLFLFTAIIWKVSRIAIIDRNAYQIGSTLGVSRHLGWTDSSLLRLVV
jgi:hypothetical protein